MASQVAPALRVVVWSKPDCGLCDDVLRELAQIAADVPCIIESRDILAEPLDLERFRYLIPVVQVQDGPLLYPPHDRQTLAAAVRAEAIRTGRLVAAPRNDAA